VQELLPSHAQLDERWQWLVEFVHPVDLLVPLGPCHVNRPVQLEQRWGQIVVTHVGDMAVAVVVAASVLGECRHILVVVASVVVAVVACAASFDVPDIVFGRA